MSRRFVVISILIIIIGGSLVFSFIKPKFNADFATSIIVTYKYGNQYINEKIIDDAIVADLKNILKGKIYNDSPSCGFSTNISITLENDEKAIILCLALDGCPIIRVGETNKYFKISDKNKKKLDNILSKYGFHFPCV